MARGLPRGRAPPPIPEGRCRLRCASPRLRGERTPERCCPRQSCAAALVAQLANLFPGGASHGRLQPLALERRFAETEFAAPFALREHATEPLFNQGLQRGVLATGRLAGFLEEAVGNLDGRLHMASHISHYGSLSTWGAGITLISCFSLHRFS